MTFNPEDINKVNTTKESDVEAPTHELSAEQQAMVGNGGNNQDDNSLEDLQKLIDKMPTKEEQAKRDAEDKESLKKFTDAVEKAYAPNENEVPHNTNWITGGIKDIVKDIEASNPGTMDRINAIKDLITKTKEVNTKPSVLSGAATGMLIDALKESAYSAIDEKINEVKAINGVDVDKKGPGSGIHLELQSVMAGKLIDDLENIKADINKM